MEPAFLQMAARAAGPWAEFLEAQRCPGKGFQGEWVPCRQQQLCHLSAPHELEAGVASTVPAQWAQRKRCLECVLRASSTETASEWFLRRETSLLSILLSSYSKYIRKHLVLPCVPTTGVCEGALPRAAFTAASFTMAKGWEQRQLRWQMRG